MTQEIINIGAQPNDGEGDPLRTAFAKVNNNFTQLYSTGFVTSTSLTPDDTAGQVIFETPVESFTQAIIQINSNDTSSNDSENITLTVAMITDGSGVTWNGYNTLFNGNVLTDYDVDVFESNVRVIVNPFIDTEIFHFISAQITWTGVPVPGLNLILEGATETNIETENQIDLETENQITV